MLYNKCDGDNDFELNKGADFDRVYAVNPFDTVDTVDAVDAGGGGDDDSP